MQRRSGGWLLGTAIVCVAGCASAPVRETYQSDAKVAPSAPLTSPKARWTAPPRKSVVEGPMTQQAPAAQRSLSKVHQGMSFAQVVEVPDPPTSQSQHLTASAFTPWSFGNEGQTKHFYYAKLGRVIFAGPDYRGQKTEVIAAEEDPHEPGHE